MDAKQQDVSGQFQKKIIANAAQIFIFGCLSAYSLTAGAALDNKKWMHTVNYLDPAVWTYTADENSCFNAAPKSLMEVEPVVENGKRVYKISQYFDMDIEKQLYNKPIDDQIKDHKIVGKTFCKGVVSISDMEIPFAKGDGINDANDGLLLTSVATQKIAHIMEQLEEMTALATQASSGTYSSTQLEELNIEFGAMLAEVNTTAQRARFNGFNLLDGSHSMILVNVDGGAKVISIPLTNFTTGSGGLSIATLDVTSQADSQTALSSLSSSTLVTMAMSNLLANDIELKAAAIRDATTTLVDVRKDQFVVQHKGPADVAKELS